MENKIGLIAGNGRFPILFVKAAQKKGIQVIAIGINEETSKELEEHVEKVYWLGVGELGKLFQILQQEKLTAVVMAGQVKHSILFDETIELDKNMQQLLGGVKDKKTDSLIGALAKRLEQKGVKLLPSTTFLSDYLPQKGVLTKKAPGERILEDIEFGKSIAKPLAGLDIGQTVVVKDKAVLAVESIEGTDEAIKRGAHYGKEGIVVIKVSKPDQDMRFDIPVVGPDTIQLLARLKSSCIAIEAQKTLIIDREKTVKLADELGVAIVVV